MFKKLFYFVIVFVLVGLLFVGLVTNISAQEKIKLVFLRSGGAAEEAVIGPQIEVFKKETGINVDLVMVPWGQAFTKMMTMIGAGDAPDLAYVGSRWIPYLANMKAIVPIDVPEMRKAEYFDTIWSMVTLNDKIYGVPRAFSTKVLYYNTDLFEKAGIAEPPKTWLELEAAAKAITEKTDAYGFALAGEKFVSTTSQFFNFLFQNGGRVFDEEGNVVINNTKGIETLEFYASLEKYAEEGPVAWKREELWEIFAAGKVGMYISGPWRVHAFEDAGISFATAPLPAGPKGESATIIVSDSLVVFTQSAHPKEAAKLALFLTNSENQTALDTKWGMTPQRIEETKLEFFQTPTWKTFITMIPRGIPQPLIMDWELLEDAVTDAIQERLLLKATAKEALDKAAKKLEGLK